MPVDVKYTTTATATGGRDGHSATKDGALDVQLSTPKELGGGGGPGNNPEQLFAVGYAACFLGAMKFVASQGGTTKVPNDASVTSTVGIGPRSEGGFGIDVGPRHLAAGRGPGRRRGAGREGASGLPVLERHPQQRAGPAAGRLTQAA